MPPKEVTNLSPGQTPILDDGLVDGVGHGIAGRVTEDELDATLGVSPELQGRGEVLDRDRCRAVEQRIGE
jgi:hypothetical protein